MKDKKFTPCIVIPGFGQSKVELYGEDGESIKQIWPMKADVKSLAKRIIKPYIKTVLCRKDMGFTDTAYDIYTELLEPMTADRNGELKHRVRAIENRRSLADSTEKVRSYVHKISPVDALSEVIGDENIWFFAYYTFDDAYTSAKKLDEFITFVKTKTDSEKVNLLAYSMGGAVCTAYFDEYGEKSDIQKVFFLAGAMLGSQLQTDLYSRNFDKKQGYSLLDFFVSPAVGKRFRQILGATTWEVRYKLLYRSIDAVLDALTVNSSGMWELLSCEEYERLSEEYFKDGSFDVIKSKADRYHNAQKRFPEMISEQQQKGVKFFAAAGYNCRMIALSAADDVSSDLILDIKDSSLGAVSAKRGEKLPKEQINENSIISPDGTLDASACLLKDTTWFFKDVDHRMIARDGRVGEIIKAAFTEDGFEGVSERFPRFM